MADATQTPQQQLTFDVGGESPTKALIRFSGSVFVHRELPKGEEVHLQVVGADGEVVADGYGRVVGVAFKDEYDAKTKELVDTVRVHSVKVS
jgi:hypothetical protein